VKPGIWWKYVPSVPRSRQLSGLLLGILMWPIVFVALGLWAIYGYFVAIASVAALMLVVSIGVKFIVSKFK